MSCRILSWTALDPLRSLTILFWTQFLLLLLNHINPIRELSGCSVMGACAAQCPSQNFGSPSLKNLLHPQGYLYWRNFNRFGEKTQTLFHHWRNFNLLERKLTLSRENSNSRSLSKSKRKISSFIAAGCAPQMLLSLKVESPYLLFCGYIVMSFHQLESKTWILNSCARFTLHISDSSKCAIQKHCKPEIFYIWGKIEWWLVKVELVAARQQISPICLMTFDTSPEVRVGVHTFVANHCCVSFTPLAFN